MVFERHAEAGNPMARAERGERRFFVMAARLRKRAARCETAALRHGFRQRDRSGNSGKRALACAKGGDRAHQADGVRVLRVGKYRLDASLLYHLSGIHHRHLLRHFGHHA